MEHEDQYNFGVFKSRVNRFLLGVPSSITPLLNISMSWMLVVLLGLVIAWLRWRQKNKRLLDMANAFPGPPQLPLLGNAASLVVQPEKLAAVFASFMVEYGSAVRVWLGPDLNIVLSDPDDIKNWTKLKWDHTGSTSFQIKKEFSKSIHTVQIYELLLTNPKTSFKGPQYKYMADVLGGGILSGSGPTWKRHRKLAMPNYGKRAIESYNGVINQEIDLMMEWLRAEEMGVTRDIYKQIVKTTSYTICQALMGLSRGQTMELPDIQELIDLTPIMYDCVFDRMTRWYLQLDPVFWLTKRYWMMKNYMKKMVAFSTTIINYREEVLKDSKYESRRNDLMMAEGDSLKNTELSVVDRFILSQEFNDEELIQEVFTIFTSSQEASAKISSSILLMMAFHPDCQEKLYEEISSVMGDEDRWISDEDLKRMPYLDMVFNEVIRLFPIGAMIQRSIKEDMTISSGTLPAGCSLVVPVYHIQRDSRFWKNPNAFDPERFSPENVRLRHSNCYLPFSLGPMDCLGRYFGKKLIKMICVKVLREFKLTSMESYQDLKLSISISASPMHGYNIILNSRK